MLNVDASRGKKKYSHEKLASPVFTNPKTHRGSSIKNKFSDDPACPFYHATGLKMLTNVNNNKEEGNVFSFYHDQFNPFVFTLSLVHISDIVTFEANLYIRS